MRTYLFGISRFCYNLILSDAVNIEDVDGLFDNAPEKRGVLAFEKTIESPYFCEDIEIYISVREEYHFEIVTQLLELGYRRFFAFLKVSSGKYEIREFDYRNLAYENDKKGLMLLYLEHKSYSGIGAIEYMVDNHIIDSPILRVKFFKYDEPIQEYYYDMITARYFLTERGAYNRNACPYVGINMRAKEIQLWHGYPIKAMGRMLKYDNEKELEGWKSLDQIVSYGLNYTTFMCACYGLKRSQFIVSGMPRNDFLFVSNGKKNLLEKLPQTKDKKIIFYMPTFRRLKIKGSIVGNGSEKGYIFFWDDFNINRLDQFCKKNNTFLLFKLHPSEAAIVKEYLVNSDNVGILTEDMLVDKYLYEYLNAADILITDYSSVYFDYLLLNRPIIFTDYDARDYDENRGFILEPLDFWRPGPIVHTMQDLLAETEKALNGKDEFQESRQALLPFVHAYTDGKSTKRLLEFLLKDDESL